MNAKKLYFFLVGTLLITVGGSVWAVTYANSWLEQKSGSLIEQKLNKVYLDQKQELAFEAKTTIAQYGPLQDSINAVAPKEKEQDKIIAELLKIAEENGVTFGSITFPASELGKKAAAAATAKPAETGENTSAAAPATNTNSTPAAPSASGAAAAPAVDKITQTDKVDGLTGILGLRVTPSGINEIGRTDGLSYDTLLRLLDAFERNRRQMLIENIGISPSFNPDTQEYRYSLTITLTALISQ